VEEVPIEFVLLRGIDSVIVDGFIKQDEEVPSSEDVKKMEVENDATLKQLAQMGVGIDQASVTNIRLTVLLDMLLGGQDDPRRRAYEYRVQTTITRQLAEVRSNAARHRLLQAVKVPGAGALVPKRG
jgi:hypothetical protein